MRARCVEVSQARAVQAVRCAVPIEDALDKQLRLAVWIDRPLGTAFRNRLTGGRAVNRATGRKHKQLHAGVQQRVKKYQCVGDVIAEISPRVAHGFADVGVRREVNCSLNTKIANGLPQAVAIGELCFHQRAPLHRPAMSLRQIVVNNGFATRLGQGLRGVAADVARASCD